MAKVGNDHQKDTAKIEDHLVSVAAAGKATAAIHCAGSRRFELILVIRKVGKGDRSRGGVGRLNSGKSSTVRCEKM